MDLDLVDSEGLPDFAQISLDASKYFTPSQPIASDQLFMGRFDQVQTLIDAINQPGQHAVLYGERGVGKTSLANILSSFLKRYGTVIAPRIGCFSTDSYSELWRKAFNEVQFHVETNRAGLRLTPKLDVTTLSASLPEKVTHDDVRRALTQLGEQAVIVLIFDEFDTLADSPTRKAMAETVKLLSDYGVRATLIFVGVADSVAGLLEDHRSIERAMVQVRMPRMPDAEVAQILQKGGEGLGISFDLEASARITALSRGLPHYTHLLGLAAVREACADFSLTVQGGHVERAIQVALMSVQQSILEAYNEAISSSQKNHLYREVLLACAIAETDELGFFTPAAVREPLTKIKRRKYDIPAYVRHLNEFCEEKRGSMLQRTGLERKHRFRFTNPLMQPFIVLRGHADGVLPGRAASTTSAANGLA